MEALFLDADTIRIIFTLKHIIGMESEFTRSINLIFYSLGDMFITVLNMKSNLPTFLQQLWLFQAINKILREESDYWKTSCMCNLNLNMIIL